ncbi:hypothetical protein HF295_02855 [Hujiaoplasma nucleasis]|uniref:Uncharacterized protein n=1 Tax=Hujiaoplasma nucleasis TaxID=2725268 RepID=A0A7L6N5T8_9MOLU|nr:hypothetical protein [Hujiaoplasma nucleasis]QLY39854.1 hypothetical protein HF295_02855 [Hujiaoplasma nucleasis]
MRKYLYRTLIITLLFVLVGCNDTVTTDLTTEEVTSQIETSEIQTTAEETSDLPTSTEGMTSSQDTTEMPTTTEEVTTSELTTTDDLTTEENLVALRDSYYQYSIYSTQDIRILHLDITPDVLVYDMNGDEIPVDDVLYENNGYAIKSSYVLGQSSSLVEFDLVFNQQITRVSITINSKEVPYIISSTSVYTDGTVDLLFQFELFDGEINQIDGNNLEASDYLITDNALIIFSDYVSEMFIDNNAFMINYTLYDDMYIIGGILVNKVE